jgi:hypothetical protein
MRTRTTGGPQSRSGSDIAEAVLGAIGHERAIRLPLTFLAAFALHAAILLGVRHGMLGCHLPTSDAGPATKEDEFELAPLPPPARSAAVPERTTREHRPAFAKAPPSAVHAELPSGLEAARAAKVVAQVPESSTPVDLTTDEVVTGTANAYAGGLTASTGTGTSAGGQAPAAPGTRRSTLSIALDRSGPISLPTENWSCPWPSEATASGRPRRPVPCAPTSRRLAILAEARYGPSLLRSGSGSHADSADPRMSNRTCLRTPVGPYTLKLRTERSGNRGSQIWTGRPSEGRQQTPTIEHARKNR